jgi:hypothetical protein
MGDDARRRYARLLVSAVRKIAADARSRGIGTIDVSVANDAVPVLPTGTLKCRRSSRARSHRFGPLPLLQCRGLGGLVTHGKRTCVLLVTKTWDALLRAATVQVSSVVACKGWTAIARRGLRRRPRRSREHSKVKAVKVSLCVLPRKSRDPRHHSGPRVRDERTTVSDKAQ